MRGYSLLKTGLWIMVLCLLNGIMPARLHAEKNTGGKQAKYVYTVPSEYLKDKNNKQCVNEQNANFDWFIQMIVANKYILDQGDIGDPDCFLTKDALRIVRNAAYARHGRTFKSKDLQKFFYTTHKKTFKANPRYTESLLTKNDKKNIEFISGLENPKNADKAEAKFLYTIPSEYLKNKNNKQCVDEQNANFDWFIQMIVANKYIPDQGDVGDPECFLTKDALRIVRNAVYARHGRAFKSADLQKYFYTTHKKTFKVNPKYTDSMLTSNDKKNIAFVNEMENW